MAYSYAPIFIQTIQNWIQSIANGDGTTKKTLVTAATNGTRINSIIVSSSDTAARDLILGVTIGGTDYDLAIINIAIQSGTLNSAPSVDLFHQVQFPGLIYDAYGNKYMELKTGTTLYVRAGATVTPAKQLNIFAWGGDY